MLTYATVSSLVQFACFYAAGGTRLDAGWAPCSLRSHSGVQASEIALDQGVSSLSLTWMTLLARLLGAGLRLQCSAVSWGFEGRGSVPPFLPRPACDALGVFTV